MKLIKRLFKLYSRKDLVSFGNYLLSDKRNEKIKHEDKCVCGGDIDNYLGVYNWEA